MSVSASYSWGDGPDVLLVVRGGGRSRWVPFDMGGSLSLTRDEARKLAKELESAARSADRYEDDAFEDSK